MAEFITPSDAAEILGMDADAPALPALCAAADDIARTFLNPGGVAQIEESETIPPAIKFACALIIPALKSAVTHEGRQLTAESVGDYRASYARPAGDGLASFCPAAASLLRPYRAPQF